MSLLCHHADSSAPRDDSLAVRNHVITVICRTCQFGNDHSYSWSQIFFTKTLFFTEKGSFTESIFVSHFGNIRNWPARSIMMASQIYTPTKVVEKSKYHVTPNLQSSPSSTTGATVKRKPGSKSKEHREHHGREESKIHFVNYSWYAFLCCNLHKRHHHLQGNQG